MKVTSERGLELIKIREGFESKPYKCPAGYLTIGYGHRILENQLFESITKKEAHNLLVADLRPVEMNINKWIQRDLNQNQFDALVSFLMNIKMRGFYPSSNCLKYLKQGDDTMACKFWIKYCNATNPQTGKLEPLAGLLRRRVDEIKQFNTPIWEENEKFAQYDRQSV